MKRVMCIWLPDWPLQRLCLEKPELKSSPILIYEGISRDRFQIVTCSHAAAQQGIRSGMSKAEAESFLQVDDAHFEISKPAADRDKLRELAVWCRRFSPVVGIETGAVPECILINIEGAAHLFKNERAMARTVLQALRGIGVQSRIAVADTIGAAWAVAHYADDRRPLRQHVPILVPPGESRSALQSLPAQALRLPDDVLSTLREFDLCFVRRLFDLPRAALPSRFGEIVHQRIDQALGTVTETITPELPPRPNMQRWLFEYPVSDRRVVEMAIERLLKQTIRTLETERCGIVRLHILIQGELGELTDFTVGLMRPSLSQPHLMRLIRTRLERVRTPDDICEIRVALMSSAPLDPRQETLFACRDEAKAAREREQLFERLSHRLGESAVLSVTTVADSQPERAFRLDPLLRQIHNKPVPGPLRLRPIRLKPKPKPIEVLTISAHGPPAGIHFKGERCSIVNSIGPERIQTGWWREHNVARDYYRIETNLGAHLWIFRNLRDGCWFLHGVFD